VFCRNVLMYFAEPARREVLRRFHRCLVAGGLLAVSAIEAALIREQDWEPVRFGDHLFFRKAGRPAAGRAAQAAIARTRAPGSTTGRHAAPPPAAPQPETARAPAPKSEPDAPKPAAPGMAELYAQALRLADQNRNEEAVEKLDAILERSKGPTAAVALMARVRANQGRLFEALEWCDRALAADQLNLPIHYLLANVLLELSRVDEARAMFRKVLYLAPGFVLASFALGNLAWQEGNMREARLHFEHAIARLKEYPAADVIPESGGLTADRLVEIIGALMAKEAMR
jgi:chemotaxis protein methyltransferase CheR